MGSCVAAAAGAASHATHSCCPPATRWHQYQPSAALLPRPPHQIVRLPYGGSAAPAPSSKPGGGEGGAAYGLPADVWCCGVLASTLAS